MKFKTKIILLLLCLLESCIITNTPGFYSGYRKLNETDKNKIIFINNGDKNILNPKYIHSITGTSLLNYIQKYDSCAVYFWDPHCSSKSCISLNYFINKCSEKKLIPIIILNYYNFEKLDSQVSDYTNIFSINTKYYKTDYCNSYDLKFKKDLKIRKNDYYGNIFIFKSNQYLYSDTSFLPSSNIKIIEVNQNK